MILLGSTGSIGINVLNIAREFNLNIDTLVAGNNYKLLNKQIEEFKPKRVVVKDKITADKINFENVKYGEKEILNVIEESKSDIVINALVGSAGIKPTLKAKELNKKLALANKESLVMAGKFIDMQNIIPIDSEHFGLWYLNSGRVIDSMIITASGGALRDYPLAKIKEAKLEDVLKHPNWSMGDKITIDSATMVNKIFELLEARWLFGIKNIDAIIETKSVIHSMINFVDGSTTAHIANSDMRLPIAFALLEEVDKQITPFINWEKITSLEFRKIDKKRYPIWQIKEELLNRPELGVVINSANEIANKRFRERKINFIEITKFILEIFKEYENIEINSIDDVFMIDEEITKKYGEKNV
jgi:1-deoxy-D-xylulose-5-phosphate reductoisomerase